MQVSRECRWSRPVCEIPMGVRGGGPGTLSAECAASVTALPRPSPRAAPPRRDPLRSPAQSVLAPSRGRSCCHVLPVCLCQCSRGWSVECPGGGGDGFSPSTRRAKCATPAQPRAQHASLTHAPRAASRFCTHRLTVLRSVCYLQRAYYFHFTLPLQLPNIHSLI